MAAVTISTNTSQAFFTQTTTLDGVAYLLTFKYSERESVYYLDISSADGVTDYALGIKLVSNYTLLRGYPAPPGELMCLSSSADDSPPSFGQLGTGQRCELIYLEAADVYAVVPALEPERNPGPFFPS